MKKIIDGSLYNTETAKLIGSYDNGRMFTDFDYFEEELYLTRSGKYFLYGHGGGNSRYGEWHGNSGGPGYAINAMSYSEAREWAEENINADIFMAAFPGDATNEDEGEERVSITITVLPSTRARLEKAKQIKGSSWGTIIDDLVQKGLAE